MPKFNVLIILIAFFSVSYAFIKSQTLTSNLIDPISLQELNGRYDDSHTTGEFLGKSVSAPPKIEDLEIITDIAVKPDVNSNVLGDADETSEKRIEVDLTHQKVYAFEGDKKVYEFLVSTGKWGRTYPGEYMIWSKFRYTKMSGGSRALRTYYYLPNVPYVMFFANSEIPASRGYSLHGTYWHNNFGNPMSHGCINMRTEDAERLYGWANPILSDGRKSISVTKDNPGTKVVIYGTTPKS